MKSFKCPHCLESYKYPIKEEERGTQQALIFCFGCGEVYDCNKSFEERVAISKQWEERKKQWEKEDNWRIVGEFE